MAIIDMTPITCDWKAYAGDKNLQEFALFASEGIPWDLTGATFKAQTRATKSDAVIAAEAVCTVIDSVNGLLTVEWDGEDLRSLIGASASWSGFWDLEIIEAQQTLPKTLIAGNFTVALDVTRA